MQISELIGPQCQMDVPAVVSADISLLTPLSGRVCGCLPAWLLQSLWKLMAEHFGVCTVEKCVVSFPVLTLDPPEPSVFGYIAYSYKAWFS